MGTIYGRGVLYGYKFNLAIQTLSEIMIIHLIEELLRSCYNYFTQSPKKFAEFHALAILMDTKGLKLLKNVKTRWCSMIALLYRVIAEYKSLIAKMDVNKNCKKWGPQARISSKFYLCYFLFLFSFN